MAVLDGIFVYLSIEPSTRSDAFKAFSTIEEEKIQKHILTLHEDEPGSVEPSDSLVKISELA